jgi:hypothetical protein
MAKSWAKFDKVGLCDLGQSTSGISEANFAVMKGGKLAVHAQMEIDETVAVTLRQERQTALQTRMNSDRQRRGVALPCSKQASVVTELSKLLTNKAAQVLGTQHTKSKNYSFVRVARDEFLVTYALDDSSETEDDDDAHETCRPWPRPYYQRVVSVKDGKLFCSCGFNKCMLIACRHILCVKNGSCSARDAHFRWSLMWQAGRVPQLGRHFSDLNFGATCDGVDFAAPIGTDLSDLLV